MSSPLSSPPLPSPPSPSPAAVGDISTPPPPPQRPPFPSPLPPSDDAIPPPQIAPFASSPADLVPPISASPPAPMSFPPPIPTPALESPPPVKSPTLPPPPPEAPAAPPPKTISTPVIPDPSPPLSPVAPIPSRLPPFPVVPSSPLLPPPGSISPSQPGISLPPLPPPLLPSPSPYSSPPAEALPSPTEPNLTPPAPFPFEQPVIPTPVKSPELPLPLTSVNLPVKSPHSHLSTGLIVGFTISGFFILLVLGALLISYKSRRSRKTNQGKAEDFCLQPQSQLEKGPNQGEQERANKALPAIQGSYGELGMSNGTISYGELVEATDGFSESNLIGEGGFGYVHKGVLQGGQEVAIKQLKEGSRQGEREFQAEVEIISRVHHKHLVSLVGYCISGPRRLLVYEFVPNNTLEFHLHGNGQPVLAWPTRLKIAVGSAKGLAYLHEDCNPVIIHRDIKAANILLDHKFEAKVSDFGLAKSVCNARTRTTHSSTQVVGTFGYLAPEYATSGKVTEKSDVYSYGVMLLELITGRPPIGGINASIRQALVIWARPLLTRAIADGDFGGLVDPRLQGNYDASEMARMVACAAACVRHSSWLRPRMSQIARVLEGDISIGDLNEGASPGHSNLYGFGFPSSMNLDNSRNRIERNSGTTSDYGLNTCTSSSNSSEEDYHR